MGKVLQWKSVSPAFPLSCGVESTIKTSQSSQEKQSQRRDRGLRMKKGGFCFILFVVLKSASASDTFLWPWSRLVRDLSLQVSKLWIYVSSSFSLILYRTVCFKHPKIRTVRYTYQSFPRFSHVFYIPGFFPFVFVCLFVLPIPSSFLVPPILSPASQGPLG